MNVTNGTTYFYRLEDVSLNGKSFDHKTVKIVFKAHVANQWQLSDNYPNPFNSSTRFFVNIPNNTGSIKLKIIIFNLNGKTIKTLFKGELPSGTHYFTWNGTNNLEQAVSSGLYFYSMASKNFRQFKKLLLVR